MGLVSPINSDAFRRLLTPLLREVSEYEFNDLPSMIPELFNVMGSEKEAEQFFGVSELPDVPEFNGKLSYAGRAPGFHVKIEPKEFALGTITTRKFLDDNLYPVLMNNATDLVRSMSRTREKFGAKPFNTAFSSSFDFMQSEEGVSLCNDSHLTKSGTSTASGFDNSGTSALSKTSTAATWLAMRQYRNSISERIEMSDRFALIVPDTLGDTAGEIVGTPKGLETANHTKNMQQNRYTVLRHMRLDDTSTTNWFMVNIDLMKRMLLWIDRIAMETDTHIDFETKSVKHSIYGRWAYGFKDWRWIYGHNV